jgi:adenylosuccinate synthase
MHDITKWSDFIADTAEMACDDLERGKTDILEVVQCFELGVHHGFQYSNRTSRECSPMQGLSDKGIPSKHIRTYSIRISNEFSTVTKILHRVFE